MSEHFCISWPLGCGCDAARHDPGGGPDVRFLDAVLSSPLSLLTDGHAFNAPRCHAIELQAPVLGGLSRVRSCTGGAMGQSRQPSGQVPSYLKDSFTLAPARQGMARRG